MNRTQAKNMFSILKMETMVTKKIFRGGKLTTKTYKRRTTFFLKKYQAHYQ